MRIRISDLITFFREPAYFHILVSNRDLEPQFQIYFDNEKETVRFREWPGGRFIPKQRIYVAITKRRFPTGEDIIDTIEITPDLESFVIYDMIRAFIFAHEDATYAYFLTEPPMRVALVCDVFLCDLSTICYHLAIVEAFNYRVIEAYSVRFFTEDLDEILEHGEKLEDDDIIYVTCVLRSSHFTKDKRDSKKPRDIDVEVEATQTISESHRIKEIKRLIRQHRDIDCETLVDLLVGNVVDDFTSNIRLLDSPLVDALVNGAEAEECRLTCEDCSEDAVVTFKKIRNGEVFYERKYKFEDDQWKVTRE